MADDFDPLPFEQRMWVAVEALAAAQAAVDEAQKRFLEQRDAAHLAISQYGAALDLAGERVSREVIARLYWGNRETVQPKPIHQAFTIKGGAAGVASMAGPSPETYPCPDGCGTAVRKTSRSVEPQRCPSCQAEHDRVRTDHGVMSDAERAVRIAARDDTYRDLLAAGRTVEEIHADPVAPFDGDGHPLEHLQQVADEMHRNGSEPVLTESGPAARG